MIDLKCLSAFVVTGTAIAFAQAPPRVVEAESIEVDAAPSAVTVYIGRASVTRTARLSLEAGAYDLVFRDLPEALRPDSLQARVEGAARILGVDYEERTVRHAASDRAAELDRRIEETRLALKTIEQDLGLIDAQEKFLDAVSVRAGNEAKEEGGTSGLDLDAVRAQLTFLAEERSRLLKERRTLEARARELNEVLRVLEAERGSLAGGSRIERTAVVTIAVIEAGELGIDLAYLVTNALWQPVYNVRSAAGGSAVSIEYDALLLQRTGEDWKDVQLTLSTAQPTRAANPPELEPWFVDVSETVGRAESRAMAPAERRAPPGPQGGKGVGGGGPGEGGSIFGDSGAQLAADAYVAGAGPSVTFALPRLVSAESNARKQQRTRIATIDAEAEFVHVAIPVLTDHVYVRGRLTNTSAYQILPGEASIFAGQDFVGPTRLEAVAPNGSFEVHFGIDRTVSVTRTLVKKETSKTGLFAGGRRTSYDYRLEIENNAGKAITLELWDRHPVSRTDQIRIELVDVTPSLATDAQYLEEERPRGLMKWLLKVPATAKDAAAMVVT
ncbi:MAG: mucoidy inhibitor MuiA family protein, partial [Planctomycetota bacterium]|nr:mucoidy inhibitor MuiA family protein [Planctomycetota bacterium]